MAGSAWGRQVLYVWAGLDLLLITLAAWSAAGVDAALPLGYGVTIVFAVVFPIRGQAAFLAAMLACYTGVLLSTEFEFLPLAMLATLGAPACFLEVRRRIDAVDGSASRPSGGGRSPAGGGDRARPSGRRSRGRAARGRSSCRRGTRRRRSTSRTPSRGRSRPTSTSARRAAAIRSGVGPDRRPRRGQDVIVVAAGDDERQTTRILREAGLEAIAATPIIVGDRPGAILLVASDEPDPITPPELDAFAMLAAPAGLALVNAARAVDERTATEVAEATEPAWMQGRPGRARHAAVR